MVKMSSECPIHKVAKTEKISENECQSCEYFNDCLEDMGSDMSEEMLAVASKYIKEMHDAVQEHIVEKIKNGGG